MQSSRRRKLKRWLGFTALALLGFVLTVCATVWTGLADRWMRHALVGQLTKMTGGRVEIEAFHFHPLRLRAEFVNLTVHGLEPEGTPPYLHADYVLVGLRVDSFFRRKVSLDELRIDRPSAHVRIEPDGRSNVPVPKTRAQPGRPWQERVFEVAIRQLRLHDGAIFFNDVRVPLAVEGEQFRFALDFHSSEEKHFYLGQLRCQRMLLAARRYLPFRSDLALKFTLERDALEVNQLRWKLPHSDFDVQANLTSFVRPKWDFRYRGRIGLEDIRSILRKPNTPAGAVEFSGEGSYAGQQVSVRGRYAARQIAMPYEWFHTGGIESRGSYRADRHALEVPEFEARALGGVVRGRASVDFRGLKFRVDSRASGMNLAALLAAVDNRNFPVATLHWNASVDTHSVTTWTGDFKHVESRGLSLWSPAMEPHEGEIATSARLDYHYVMDRNAVELKPSEISTPTSHLEMGGIVSARDSSLEAKLDAQDLGPWNNFINALRLRLREADARPKRLTGRVLWQGHMRGPVQGPTFTGHLKAVQASYESLRWDEIEGDVTFSPVQFQLARARARRGRAAAQIELSLALDNWDFLWQNRWSLEANLVRTPTDELQALLGWSYPVRGLLTGQFRGRGTRDAPELTGLFDLAEVDAWGFQLDRFRGQLGLRRDQVRIANAELRAFSGAPPAARENGSRARGFAPGIVTGNFLYRIPEQQVAFNLTGAVIPMDGIQRLQSARLPLGGWLSFQLSGNGPLRAPAAQGTLRLVDLRVGKEVLGSFEGKLDSDGGQVRLELNSAMPAGHVQGKLHLALGDDYPLQGDISVQGVDLDPFLQAAFRLKTLTGHGSVDGRFRLSGALARPETIAVEADLSRLVFDYQYVKLENAGPFRMNYRRDEVRIEQVSLRGPDTDFRLAGSARFTGDRRLNLNLAGTMNLRLAGGLIPGLEARGPAQVHAAIEGTLFNPRITGKARVENAAATYGEFPAGLSHVYGEFVFDTSRLLFENVTAEAGGGQLLLGGTMTYGEGPLRYDLNARAAGVRVRYPEGMSWRARGALRLSGTTQAGLLSGRIVVERLLMAQGFDLASVIVASKEPVRVPITTSPYLRNLQFDVEAVSSPDARVEWTGARFESETSLRLRGTWEHPILLGHIHLLGGEMSFRGNRYRLTRGDINFANPFRLDPVVNVEAVTAVRQYDVTLNFTGPASRLTLAYRSDPPLPSSDVIALLALGRTGEESQLRSPTAVQTPELGATTLLSEAISSQLGGRLERLFGISRFRVDPFLAGTGTEQNAAARITIEQQVTRDLVITYITNVTSTQQQVIQVEYSVSRDVSIVGLRDQNGTFGLDVKFKKRFK